MTNTATAGYETFRIPTNRVQELEDRVAKLNRKAEKLGTPPISLIITDKTEEVVVSVGGTMALRMGSKFSYTVREVLLKGETPKLNGWEFLSVVLHRPAGNEFVNVMDTTLDLSEYKFTDKKCDHCGHNRVRNATFLVRHDSGDIKQVGSTCLTDYTGVKSPQAHAKQLENIFNLFRELRYGWGSTAGRTTKKFFLIEWLAFVCKDIQARGYVNYNRSVDTGMDTTASVAKKMILAASDDVNAPVPTDAHFDTASAAIEWIRSDEGHAHIESLTFLKEDYKANLFAACASDSEDAVDESTMKLTAAVPVYYSKYMADKAKPVSEHVGNVKDKVETVLKVTRKGNEYENGYGGTTTPYTLQDRQGNVYVWFATGRGHMDEGTCYKIAGTIKKHDEFRGVKQTILTRCKVLKEVGRAA